MSWELSMIKYHYRREGIWHRPRQDQVPPPAPECNAQEAAADSLHTENQVKRLYLKYTSKLPKGQSWTKTFKYELFLSSDCTSSSAGGVSRWQTSLTKAFSLSWNASAQFITYRKWAEGNTGIESRAHCQYAAQSIDISITRLLCYGSCITDICFVFVLYLFLFYSNLDCSEDCGQCYLSVFSGCNLGFVAYQVCEGYWIQSIHNKLADLT